LAAIPTAAAPPSTEHYSQPVTSGGLTVAGSRMLGNRNIPTTMHRSDGFAYSLTLFHFDRIMLWRSATNGGGVRRCALQERDRRRIEAPRRAHARWTGAKSG